MGSPPNQGGREKTYTHQTNEGVKLHNRGAMYALSVCPHSLLRHNGFSRGINAADLGEGRKRNLADKNAGKLLKICQVIMLKSGSGIEWGSFPVPKE